MKVTIPAQNVAIQTKPDVIEPIWYEKLQEIVNAVNSGAIGQGLLTTTATTGFGYLPTCAGAPTGVPVSTPSGFVPCVFDTTNHKLWVYVAGAWRGIVLT